MEQPTHVTAIAVSSQLGGTERVLLELAERVFEFGLTVRVLAPRDGPLLERLRSLGVPAEVAPAPERLLRASQQPGRLHTIPGAVAGLYAWAEALETHPFCRTADVIYTVGFKAHLAATLAQLRPLVWHLHEFPPARTGWFWRFLAQRVPDAVIVNSRAAAAAWNGLGARNWSVVLNGVNLDRFRPRTPTKWIHDVLGVPRERRLIGMPAVLARWKGQPEVIEAFNLLRDELADVDLVFVGGTIYDTVGERGFAAELKKLVEGGGGRIHLLPFQREVELAYPEFDLVVHYSIRPEPFGRVIVEAMACGVAVIAVDEGGPPEILGEGIGPRREAGWLVPPRHPGSLARTMRTALTLPDGLLRSVGAAARRRAEAVFSARRFARNVAGVARRVSKG